MNYFSFDDLGRKDFGAAIGMWLTLELACFQLVPMLGLITPSDRFHAYFLISLPLGIGGAFLIGLSSRYLAIANEFTSSFSKSLQAWMGQIMGWSGFAGIIFPLLVVSMEFLAGAFHPLQNFFNG